MATRKIWIYWHQGWEQAPSLVKQCKDSWARLNPDFEIHALDQNSLFDYVDFPEGIDIQREDLTIQIVSDLGRLALLSEFGGVWTDATVMCTRPLSEWLDEYYRSRFFAIRPRRKDHLMSSWFIAAESENIILRRLYTNFSDFYVNNYFSHQGTALGNALLNVLSRLWNSDVRTTLKWHSWFARRVLRVYPYFIVHYTFNKLILEDPECAKLWGAVKPFPSDAPHYLQYFETAKDGIARAKREIDHGNIPMHKLNWRVDSSNNYWSTILPYLQNQS